MSLPALAAETGAFRLSGALLCESRSRGAGSRLRLPLRHIARKDRIGVELALAVGPRAGDVTAPARSGRPQSDENPDDLPDEQNAEEQKEGPEAQQGRATSSCRADRREPLKTGRTVAQSRPLLAMPQIILLPLKHRTILAQAHHYAPEMYRVFCAQTEEEILSKPLKYR
jgi:hypothetical protein